LEGDFLLPVLYLLSEKQQNYFLNIDKIIQGCQSKVPKCQEALVRLYAPILINICKRYVYDPDLAYDAMQECFLNTFKYIEKYSGKGSFDGWIKRIAVNCALGVRKKMKGELYIHEMDQVLHITTDIPDAVARLKEEELLKIVDELPESCAVIFKLYVLEGYPHKDIAKMLGIKESSSRSQLARGREKLILRLRKLEENEYRRMDNLFFQVQQG